MKQEFYGQQFVTDVFESFDKDGIKPVKYVFNIKKTSETQSGEDFSKVPVKIQIDFASDFTNEELQDKVARYSIINRIVEVFIQDETGKTNLIGQFRLDVLETPWDFIEVIAENPFALKTLIEVCSANVLKKLFPLQK